ncbi:hypothetical protein F5146DRAFT_1119527 [Armillaria mellea]|nr:hypothetical protein F5146DRAFT_1119527 [Armillaria mellea]
MAYWQSSDDKKSGIHLGFLMIRKWGKMGQSPTKSLDTSNRLYVGIWQSGIMPKMLIKKEDIGKSSAKRNTTGSTQRVTRPVWVASLSLLVAKDDEDDDANGKNNYNACDPTSNSSSFSFAPEGNWTSRIVKALMEDTSGSSLRTSVMLGKGYMGEYDPWEENLQLEGPDMRRSCKDALLKICVIALQTLRAFTSSEVKGQMEGLSLPVFSDRRTRDTTSNLFKRADEEGRLQGFMITPAFCSSPQFNLKQCIPLPAVVRTNLRLAIGSGSMIVQLWTSKAHQKSDPFLEGPCVTLGKKLSEKFGVPPKSRGKNFGDSAIDSFSKSASDSVEIFLNSIELFFHRSDTMKGRGRPSKRAKRNITGLRNQEIKGVPVAAEDPDTSQPDPHEFFLRGQKGYTQFDFFAQNFGAAKMSWEKLRRKEQTLKLNESAKSSQVEFGPEGTGIQLGSESAGLPHPITLKKAARRPRLAVKNGWFARFTTRNRR